MLAAVARHLLRAIHIVECDLLFVEDTIYEEGCKTFHLHQRVYTVSLPAAFGASEASVGRSEAQPQLVLVVLTIRGHIRRSSAEHEPGRAFSILELRPGLGVSPLVLAEVTDELLLREQVFLFHFLWYSVAILQSLDCHRYCLLGFRLLLKEVGLLEVCALHPARVQKGEGEVLLYAVFLRFGVHLEDWRLRLEADFRRRDFDEALFVVSFDQAAKLIGSLTVHTLSVCN